jgi:hypothetical protein
MPEAVQELYLPSQEPWPPYLPDYPSLIPLLQAAMLLRDNKYCVLDFFFPHLFLEIIL